MRDLNALQHHEELSAVLTYVVGSAVALSPFLRAAIASRKARAPKEEQPKPEAK